ncbi:MAG: type IV pilin-like G/H family protein [Pseudanabaenaceae cyanobacterium]
MTHEFKKNKTSQRWISIIISGCTSLVVSLVALLFFYTNQPVISQVQSSVLSQMVGTWKIESSTPEPLTMIVSPEGKFTIISPTNPKEAVEIAKLTRLSDSTKVPDGVTVQTMAMMMASQRSKARQSEAKVSVGAMNRGQQAYFIENSKWGDSIESLGVGIKPETTNYRYRTEVVKSTQTIDNAILQAQKIPPDPGIAIQTGIAKQSGLKSYLGAVYLRSVTNPPSSPRDVTSMAILCESEQPTMTPPDLPKFNGETMQCPAGYISFY